MNPDPYARLSDRVYRQRTGRAGTMEYLLGEHDGARVLAFRGTSKNSQKVRGPGWWQNLKDWGALVRDILHDVRIIPVYDDVLGWRPAGFLHAANDVAEEIIARFPDKARPFDLTGHSLGGAVAALVGERLVSEGYWVRNVVLFGTPRCGACPRLTSTYSSARIRSYKFGRDVVCSVPPFWRPAVPYIQIGVSSDRLHDHGIENYLKGARSG